MQEFTIKTLEFSVYIEIGDAQHLATPCNISRRIETPRNISRLPKVVLLMLFNGSKSKLLVYIKKDADPHCEINGTDVSTCEKTIHLGNVLSTTDKYEMVFDGIKTFN